MTNELIERVARALAKADGIQICEDATYALSSYREGALAAIAAMQANAAEQAAELAKFKALAETLAGALEQMHRAVCHETGFAEAVRADSGLAYPWEPLDVAADASLKALREYKEARDAS